MSSSTLANGGTQVNGAVNVANEITAATLIANGPVSYVITGITASIPIWQPGTCAVSNTATQTVAAGAPIVFTTENGKYNAGLTAGGTGITVDQGGVFTINAIVAATTAVTWEIRTGKTPPLTALAGGSAYSPLGQSAVITVNAALEALDLIEVVNTGIGSATVTSATLSVTYGGTPLL